MGFEFYKESYAGAVREITIGEGSKAVTVGGETCYPFYQFEGDMPNKPKIAMEVWDVEPTDWPEAAISPFEEVIDNPAAWAQKCVSDYGADIIVLQLKSIDPNGINASPEDAASTVKKVLEAIDVPLIVWGIANAEKDEAVFKVVSEVCQDSKLTLGPVEDKNHKSVGAAVMGYGHSLISSSPIDVNLAKQINILLENLGLSMDKVIIDPTTGGLGYGLEYSYSVMERLRMAAITQGDDKLQLPIINNLGNEIWKCKEVKQTSVDAPLLGDPEKRGILMEAVGAVAYLSAGSDILIMRHPESVRLIKAYINLVMDGGSGMEVAPISKLLDDVSIDFASLSPIPDLTIEKESKENLVSKKVVAKKAVAKKAVAKKAVAKKAVDEKAVSEKAVSEKAVSEKATAEKETAEKAAAEKAAAEKAAAEKAAAEKAAAEKAAAEKAVAEKAAAEKAVAEKTAAEKENREKKEEAIKEKRAEKRSKIAEKRIKNFSSSNTEVTIALEQKSDCDKILDKLNWVHKRIKLYEW